MSYPKVPTKEQVDGALRKLTEVPTYAQLVVRLAVMEARALDAEWRLARIWRIVNGGPPPSE